MTDFHIILFLWMSAMVVLTWAMPTKWQVDLIAVATAIFLLVFSPWSALWLFGASVMVYLAIRTSADKRPVLIGAAIFFLSGVFILYKGLGPMAEIKGITLPVMLGLSYYTCRHIHVLIEVYKGGINTMTLRQYLRYQFFFPVMIVGPIHRYQKFSRECERRRADRYDLTSGLERILYGYVKVVVIGNYLLNMKLQALLDIYAGDGVVSMLFISAKFWLSLYAQFSGYTDVALGFALLVGFRIEENFNNPLGARNLIEFWQRWHITLSNWCKDYVFSPVQAKTRNQLLGVFSAMIVLGIWHEVSLYYFLWGIYHALGIMLCRLYQLKNDPLRLALLPDLARNTIRGGATFGWLIGGMPVITTILKVTGAS